MKGNRREKGQGLVEYALIIVLVAIVVIVALSALGPIVGDVFSQIAASLQGPGVIGSASATPDGGGVIITVTVSEATDITISGDVSGGGPCSGSCQFPFSSPSSGSATVTASGGGITTVSW